MESPLPKSKGLDPPRIMTNFSMAQIILRSVAAVCTLSAAIVLATAKQTIVMYNVYLHAQYSSSSAYKFLFYVDVAVCCFSLLSLLFACVLGGFGSLLNNIFVLHHHDMVMMVLLISGCSAATAIGYVGEFGQEKMQWYELCDRVGKFCNQVMISLVLSYLAFFCYMALTIMGTKYNKAKAKDDVDDNDDDVVV